jgi:hypothetical protein
MQQSQPQRQVFLETHVCSYFSPKMAAPRRVPTNDLVVWTLGWTDVLPLWEGCLAVERPAPAALDLNVLEADFSSFLSLHNHTTNLDKHGQQKNYVDYTFFCRYPRSASKQWSFADV